MSKKHYILTAVTLGSIAAVAAGVIGLTNLITKDRIAKNEQIRIQNGIKEVFGKDSEILNEFKISDKNYEYLVYGYEVKNETDNLSGYAIRTLGSNMYGKISLIVGVYDNSTEYVFGKLSVVVDEQTYASTLEDEYINVINGDSSKIDDVSCGATYGAKLVRNMIEMTVSYANDVLGAE